MFYSEKLVISIQNYTQSVKSCLRDWLTNTLSPLHCCDYFHLKHYLKHHVMVLPDLPDFLSDRWISVGQPHSCSRSLGSRDVIKPHHAVLELARWAVTPTSPLRNHFPGRYPKALGRPSVCLFVGKVKPSRLASRGREVCPTEQTLSIRSAT